MEHELNLAVNSIGYYNILRKEYDLPNKKTDFLFSCCRHPFEEEYYMNIRFLGQSTLQIIGLLYATKKYKKKDINSVDCYVPAMRYQLPFDGEWYTINGGITKDISHSWEVLPQRFAYDFFMINEEGKSYSGDKTDLQNYFCYGKDILAPADGVVISVKEGFPDCRIMENGQPDPDTPDIGGNRVIIKHSANEYSATCHLMPGSIRIKKGQLVKRGDVIAKCGNSGNTTEPHIHFHLQNTPHFYSCMGLPILFSDIHTNPFAKYSEIDPRSLPEKVDIRDGYIHRGLLVKNIRNK